MVVQRIGAGIKHIAAIQLHLGRIAVKIKQAGSHILHGELLQSLGKRRLVAGVLRLDRRVFRLSNLLDRHAPVLLVETVEVVGEVLACHTGDIVAGNIGNCRRQPHKVLPGHTCRHGCHHQLAALGDGLQFLLVFTGNRLLDGLQLFVGEFTILEFLNLLETQILGSLDLAQQLGYDHHGKARSLVQGHVGRHRHIDTVLVGQLVEQTRLVIIIEQAQCHLHRRSVGIIVGRATEHHRTHADNRYREEEFLLGLAVNRGCHNLFTHRLDATFQLAESTFQQGQQRLGIDVTRENQTHIRSHIVFLVEGLHVRLTRILQVLGAADNWIGIRCARQELAGNLLQHHGSGVIAVHVLLFIDRLQLTLEQAEDGMHETMAVQFAPLLNELGRKSVVIIGEIIGCARIQFRAAILGNQAVELVRDSILRSLDVQLVDVVLNDLARLLIGCTRQQVIFHRNGVQIDPLGGIIHRSQLVGALEHDVLKIVGNARVGAIHRTSAHYHGTKDLGLAVVDIEPHLHAVAQFQFLYL